MKTRQSLLLLAFLLLFAATNWAATPNKVQQTAISWASKTPPTAKASIGSLGAYLGKVAQDEYTQALTIYCWLSQNLRYDYESYGYWKANLPMAAQAPEIVLKRGTAVCSGYSQLFEALCTAAGLECKSINGYAKGAGYQPGDVFMPFLSNHAWNAVKINGKWELIDATWGDCLGENATPNFFYFCTSPRQLISSHLPIDKQWQLMDEPWTLAAFQCRPQIYPAFYGLGLENYLPKVATIHLTGKSLQIKLKHDQPETLTCTAGFEADDEPTSRHVPSTIHPMDHGMLIDLEMQPSQSGYLSIFVGTKNSPMQCVLRYRIEAIPAS
jgi:transglutaminase/protease-like cytokinesis protein 3